MSRTRLIKILIILAVGLVIALVIYFFLSSKKHSEQALINIYVIPEDATVKIDGQTTKERSQYVQPGTHKVEASKTGFRSDVRTIEVSKKDVRDLYLLPHPESREATAWLEKNPDIQRLREAYTAHNVGYIQSLLQKKYPIIKELPKITPYYRIDYGMSEKSPNDPESLAIYITAANQANRDWALRWIEDKGFDPEKLEIIYREP